jgi:hypothetical protein
VPSTNFVLRASGDLLNWTTMTNVPILDAANLQNVVSLPAPGANTFFRLTTY